MTHDQRLQDLVAEFQRRTYEAYNEGGMPFTVFSVKYATENTTMISVWEVPDIPAAGCGSQPKSTNSLPTT